MNNMFSNLVDKNKILKQLMNKNKIKNKKHKISYNYATKNKI